jgi:hypothetical protein
MSESQLKKEFSQRDVKRMRDLITGNFGDRTQVQVGYEKQNQDHQEGDVWEVDGKTWTIKNGIKQTVTKYDNLKRMVTMPLACPNCGRHMKVHEYNKKMWAIHKTCFDCVIEYETKLRQEGKFEEYQKNIFNSNKDALLDETLEAIDDWASITSTFVNEAGDVESWGGGAVSKEEVQTLKDQIKELKKRSV